MQTFFPVIGLEIHVQLNTMTKLFCSCKNDYDPEQPNTNICPFCTGQPGALPLLNKAAVEKAILFGIAVGAKIPEKTRWDRKNYFYPDLPSGYQISQYDNPIVVGGGLDFWVENKENGNFVSSFVELTRAHLEADAAKLQHIGNKSYVDFNRSCAPLIEIVTEPVITSSAQAMAFVSELQLLVRKLGISDGDMEKGQMRFDCNLSLQTKDQNDNSELPKYRTETKNINSIRALGRAIEFEIARQSKLLEQGITPEQETRGWKDDQNKSVTQRSKEDAMDYRYFPEPDLKILEIRPEDIPGIENLPVLPNQQRLEYMDIGLSVQIANTLVTNENLGDFFNNTLKQKQLENLSGDKNLTITMGNLLTGVIFALILKNEKTIEGFLDEISFLKICKLFSSDKINNKAVQTILDQILLGENDIDKIIEENNLLQVTDTKTLLIIVERVLEQNQKVTEEYKSGKIQVIGFLVGQCMKEAKGSGNPKIFNDLLVEKLS
jgi:aspartyl-tRNA(Asn)/glutamyl-tRNA(Gln) amidotransferase subunit B